MGRFKIKTYKRFVPLNYRQRIYLSFIKKISKFKLTKSSIPELISPLHSSIGRVNGRICTRARVASKKFYIPNINLSKKFFRYRVISKYKHNKFCLVISNSNSIQYSVFPYKNVLGESILRLTKKRSLFFDEERKKQLLKQQGTVCPLRFLPTGTYIYNIEQKPYRGPVIARSFGSTAQILTKQVYKGKAYASVKLPSKKIVYLSLDCLASLGKVSSLLKKKRTAGYSFRIGRRPKVRGVAMNPVDHPHGGGEGKKSNPKSPKNPWGTQAKWVKTLSKAVLEKRNKFAYKMKRFARNYEKKKK